jgi:16S rRNA (uracil1498-N3)-methyltransferase
MVLEQPCPWSQLAGRHADLQKFLADKGGFPASKWPAIARGRAAILAIGPEGGFTPAERALADDAGWLAISLSVNTLRIETAGLAGCAALFSRAEELSA